MKCAQPHRKHEAKPFRAVGCIGLSGVAKSLQRTLREVPDRMERKPRRTGATANGLVTEAAKRIGFKLVVCPT